jgi:hypothetical protein
MGMSDEILTRLERLEDMEAVLVDRPTLQICGGADVVVVVTATSQSDGTRSRAWTSWSGARGQSTGLLSWGL